MKKSLSSFFWLVILVTHLSGQSPLLDSLKNDFNNLTELEQIDKLNLLVQIMEQTKHFHPDTAVFYAQEYLGSYNPKNNINEENLRLFMPLATAFSKANRKQEALSLTVRLIDFTEENKFRSPHLMSLLGASSLNLALDRPEKSNAWFQRALDYSKNGEPTEEGLVHAFMSELELKKSSTPSDKYFEHIEKAFQVFEEAEDFPKAMIMAFNAGTGFANKEKETEARFYFEKAIGYASETNAVPVRAGAGVMLGQTLNKQGKLNEAEQITKAALEDAEIVGNVDLISKANHVLGSINFSREQFRAAIPFYEKAEAGFRTMDDFEALSQTLVTLKDCYAEIGEHGKAFEVYRTYEAAKDSVLSIEKIATEEELTARFKSNEQAQELELQAAQLKRQRGINLLIGLTTFFIGIFAWLSWRMAVRRKETNNQLRRLDLAKSRFFANISHELRTPLTLILAPLENALNKVKSSTVKKDLETAHSSGKKLLTLVNEILDLSKLESGEMQLSESPVHLEDLMRRIFFSYHSLAQIRGLILSFSYHLPQDLTVKLDIGKFEKVLNNLLSNAFKYSNTGGVITMRSSREKNNLKIEIQDKGKGIPPGELEKIFDRFYQAEGEKESLQGGTGIGLAYAREIAHLFKGKLIVESEIGEGSTFTFTFPMKKASLERPAVVEVQDEKSIADANPVYPLLSNKKPHLLIVEDNPEMSQFLIRSLSEHFRCTPARDGVEALKFLDNSTLGQQPDLITSDVMMPNMDGFTFLEKVHGLERFRKTPFIMLTARAMEEDKLKGFSLGVDDYMTKPFSTRELIARIQNLLRNKEVREVSELEDSQDKLKQDEEMNHDERLVRSAEAYVLDHLSDGGYRVTDLAKDLNYSTRQLERLLKKLTGLSPVEFIREIRLQKAFHMLRERRFATVAEVRYEVGMESASHFNTKFRERFGTTPSEVAET